MHFFKSNYSWKYVNPTLPCNNPILDRLTVLGADAGTDAGPGEFFCILYFCMRRVCVYLVMSCDYQLWSEEPLTRVQFSHVVTGHARVLDGSFDQIW